MRPDQQQAKGVVSVLECMRDKLTYSYGLAYRQEPQEAIDAVAEYIAANDELIAAQFELGEYATYDEHGAVVPKSTYERMEAAELRHKLAHARMKGETK